MNNERNKQKQQQQKTKDMNTTTKNTKVTATDIFSIAGIVCLIVTISVTIASVA